MPYPPPTEEALGGNFVARVTRHRFGKALMDHGARHYALSPTDRRSGCQVSRPSDATLFWRKRCEPFVAENCGARAIQPMEARQSDTQTQALRGEDNGWKQKVYQIETESESGELRVELDLGEDTVVRGCEVRGFGTPVHSTLPR
ncbi:hypothetical protein Tsubulata_038989 [Turnera subulata]|uniref:Uncharacterized protein n=1 Tax=Turnera subulata TaxID=218843 RepID=A0A9Q0G3Z3_9ROSI|nr:hypothetical protein Tsubulata_038989 [Turnera subulata]